MKTRPTLALIAASFVLSPLAGFADEAPAPATQPAAQAPAAAAAAVAPAAPAAAPAGDKKTELDLRMDRVGKAFRKLRKQVADPTQNVASLALLATMNDALTEAADLTPEKTEDLPADQRAKFIEDFKAGLKGMQDEFTKLGVALTAGQNDDAVKIVADIGALEKKDHGNFRRPDDK
jgi:hypothetical protein